MNSCRVMVFVSRTARHQGGQYSGLIPLSASWRSLWQGVVTFEGFLAGKRAWYSSGRYGRVPDDCPPSFFFHSLMVA